MKKNLFNIYINNSSGVVDDQSHGSQVGQETCEPCSLECKKMNININGRKLSDLNIEEIDHLTSVFKNLD